jgi:hypothetical protein
MYDAFFMGYADSDFLFNLISKFFSDRGYEYASVYKFHIVLIGIGFFYFISRASYASVFGIITIYLLFQIIAVSNQIRYYVAFPLFLIAVYKLIVSRNKFSFFLFFVLSLLSHTGVILMYPFVYFYYYVNNEIYLKKLIVYSVVLAALFYFVFMLDFIFSFHFGAYFTSDFLSSISGGLFNNLIWIIWILLIYMLNTRLLKLNSEEIESDVMYQFLYKLSLYSIIFFLVSIPLQILAHRYIIASLIVWLTFYFYSLKYEKSLKSRLLSISVLTLIISGTFFYMYFLPTILLGISGTEVVLQLFLYNEFFNSNL